MTVKSPRTATALQGSKPAGSCPTRRLRNPKTLSTTHFRRRDEHSPLSPAQHKNDDPLQAAYRVHDVGHPDWRHSADAGCFGWTGRREEDADYCQQDVW